MKNRRTAGPSAAGRHRAARLASPRPTCARLALSFPFPGTLMLSAHFGITGVHAFQTALALGGLLVSSLFCLPLLVTGAMGDSLLLSSSCLLISNKQ